MTILQEPISRNELKTISKAIFGDMVKCVADIELGIIALNAELHADLEKALLDSGSNGENLWGFNLYPDESGDDFIEFDSLINIRSWQGNPTRDICDPEVREAIKALVERYFFD